LRLSLHLKITVLFILIIAVILSAVYFYLEYNLRNNTLQRIRGNLFKQTDLVRFILEKYPEDIFWSGDIDTAADEISSRLKVRVSIIDSKGKVVGDSDLDKEDLKDLENHKDRPEIRAAFSSGTGESIRFSRTLKEDLLYFAAFFDQAEFQGVVRLSLPLSEIRTVSDRLKKILLFSLLFAFILALSISAGVSYFISRPVKEAAWVARSIAHGDFSRKVPSGANDELGDLARSINHMSGQIKARIEEVNTNRSRLETVLASMVEGVMVVDSKGVILLMNQALQDLFSLKEDPAGRRPLEVIRNIKMQEIAENAYSLKEGTKKYELSLFVPEEKILLINVSPLRQDSLAAGAVLVFHDITELRRLEKVRRDFVANASHELRTPIASIKGYAETLLEGALEDKKNARDFLKIIYDDSERLSRLITDLLDLSRIESVPSVIKTKPCDLKPLVEKAGAGLKKQAEKKGLALKIDLPSDLPRVRIDQSQIIEVLLNLIDNAIKYTEPGGEIVISAREEEKTVKIEVKDTGIGIPEKHLSRIFERFYRVDKARSRALGGTGLGLSIVKHIIQSHGGEVFVRSIPGRGSVFSFILPVS